MRTRYALELKNLELDLNLEANILTCFLAIPLSSQINIGLIILSKYNHFLILPSFHLY
jgi:hypothetical protein